MNSLHLSESELLLPSDGIAQELSRELIWSWNQIILRSKFPGTPAGFSSEVQRQQALDQWEKQLKTYRAAHTYTLISSEISEPEHFVGRSKELDTLHRLFLSGGGTAKVLLHGMGGMGKTTLAVQYATQHKNEYDHVIFLSYHTDLLHTVCDDGQLQITNFAWNADRFKNQAAYFKEKWQLLSRLLIGQHSLLILDDMNSIKDKKLPLLWELPCDMLVTSRISGEEWSVNTVEVEALQNRQDWDEFYRAYAPENMTAVQTENLNRYRLQNGGNTLLMQLAVCNNEMCDTVGTGLEAYFLRSNMLNSNDAQALRYLSLLPVSGIEQVRFLSASGLKKSTLQKLISLSLVWQHEENGGASYGLHPVIAESVRRYYKPTPENCSRFLIGIGLQYADIWSEAYTEVSKAVPICRALLSMWSKPRAWMADSYDALATVLWIGGYFDESLRYMMALYRECIAYYGEIHQVTGAIALRVAAVYHNSLRFPQAKQWYQTALEILQKSKPHNSEYHYRVMQAAFKMARAERHEGNPDSAMAYLETAQQASAQYRNTKAGRIAFSKGELWFIALEKAKILSDMGKPEESLTLCGEIEAGYLSEFPNRYHLLAELHIFKAELELRLGHGAQALRLAEECVETVCDRRGETAKDTLGCYEILADAYAAMGRHQDASVVYRRILDTLKRYYPLQKNWVQKIEGKENAVRCGRAD